MTIKLRSRVVEIEAVEYTGLVNGLISREVVDFVGSGPEGEPRLAVLLDGTAKVWNELEGQWINIPVGHYVLKGLKGEFYPCEPEALFMKYEVIE